MLFSYQQQTQFLLSDIKQELINPAMLARYINIARGQVAGEAECIKKIGTISTTVGTNVYNFSSINTGISATTGIAGSINVSTIQYNVASGQKWIAPRAWPWFQFYHLNNPVPVSGPPSVWSQYAQGVNGSFYVDPVPDLIYTFNCDCTCYPIDLVTDTTVEAIPYLWIDAVPYFAAYLAYVQAQKQDMAKSMFEQYTLFVQRARQFANPSVNKTAYAQATDPVQLTKFGLVKAAKEGAA
ncbi:MAG: hypothetical protein KGL39_17255 [Patescibacteria group bacterium]|nr:hypothetical protein [Patescibacteria group bacterium]